LLNEILISKESILKEYSDIDGFFKSAIESLYSGTSSVVEIFDVMAKDIINDSDNNNLEHIDKCKRKTGVYIFLGKDNLPKYIGKGGTSNSTDLKAKDLRYRISQELCPFTGNNQNTLSKNIIEVESVLHSKKISELDSIEIIKSFKIRILILGERLVEGNSNKPMIKKVETLEVILLALLPSKYNK
jgi:hypothetical protein